MTDESSSIDEVRCPGVTIRFQSLARDNPYCNGGPWNDIFPNEVMFQSLARDNPYCNGGC